MRLISAVLLCSLLPAGAPALANAATAPVQAASEASAPARSGTYKLVFTVTEMAKGRVTGRRSYTSLFSLDHSHGSIRAGVRVPVVSGSGSTNSNMNTQFQYLDVGTNVDFHSPDELSRSSEPQQLPLSISIEVSSYVDSTIGTMHKPLIRQDKWNSDFVLDLGKPTLLFSSDDPTADSTTQVELTVTRVKLDASPEH